MSPLPPSSPALTTCTHLGASLLPGWPRSHTCLDSVSSASTCVGASCLLCLCVSSSLLTEIIPFHCQVVFHGGEGHSCGFPSLGC